MPKFFDLEEIDVRKIGAAIDVCLLRRTGGFRIGGAPLGIVEVEGFNCLEEPDVFVQVGKGFAVLEIFEHASLDGRANGAEEGVAVLIVANVSGSSVLSEDGDGRLGRRGSEETRESATRGGDAEAAFGPRTVED